MMIHTLLTGLVPIFLYLGSAHALKMSAYWSAFAYPNTPPTVASGGGDASTLDAVYLFAVDMALTGVVGHSSPYDANGQFYKFADTFDTATSTDMVQGTAQGAAPFGGVQPVAAPPSGTPSATPNTITGKTHAATIRGLTNSNTSVICTFGGWTMDDGFTGIAADDTKAQAFAANAVRFVITNDYDGIDIDWEYPASKGSTPAKYAALLKTIKAAMVSTTNNPQNKKLTLSIAVPARSTDLTAVMPPVGADLTTMKDAVDIFNAMAYDNINGDDTKTGPFTGAGVVKALVKSLTGTYTIDSSKINAGWAAFTRQWPLQSNDVTASCGSATPKISDCNVQGLGGYTGWALPNMTCDFPMNEKDATTNQGSSPDWTTLYQSWVRAAANPSSDGAGASYFIDQTSVLGHWLFWSFATAADVSNTAYGCPTVNSAYTGLYGHFVFSLNEDASGSALINAVATCAGKTPRTNKRSIGRNLRLD